MLHNEKIAYLSGLIDGEGSISIEIQSEGRSRKINYYSVRLCIINTNLKLLQWVVDNFGGSIITRKKIVGQRVCYRWNLLSFNAANLLKECLPFLIEKKERAEILIEFMSLKTSHYLTNEVIQRRIELYKLCKKLNHEKNGEPFLAPCHPL